MMKNVPLLALFYFVITFLLLYFFLICSFFCFFFHFSSLLFFPLLFSLFLFFSVLSSSLLFHSFLFCTVISFIPSCLLSLIGFNLLSHSPLPSYLFFVLPFLPPPPYFSSPPFSSSPYLFSSFHIFLSLYVYSISLVSSVLYLWPTLFYFVFLHLPFSLFFALSSLSLFRYLSMRQAGKGVILQLATENLKSTVEAIIKKGQRARTSVCTFELFFWFSLVYHCIFLPL